MTHYHTKRVVWLVPVLVRNLLPVHIRLSPIPYESNHVYASTQLLIRMPRIRPNSLRTIRAHSWHSDVLLLVVALLGARLGAQAPRQTQADDYTRYELL